MMTVTSEAVPRGRAGREGSEKDSDDFEQKEISNRLLLNRSFPSPFSLFPSPSLALSPSPSPDELLCISQFKLESPSQSFSCVSGHGVDDKQTLLKNPFPPSLLLFTHFSLAPS